MTFLKTISNTSIVVSLTLILLNSCDFEQYNSHALSNYHEVANFIYPIEEISQIDDCTKNYKYLNDYRVCINNCHSRNHFSPFDTTYSLQHILIQENIDSTVFEKCVEILKENDVRQYHKHLDYSILVLGGAMGDIQGVVVAHNDAKLVEGFEFRLNDHYYISVGKELNENIHYFSGG